MIGSSSRIVALSAALAAISGNAGAFRTASDVAEFGGDARVAWEDSAVSFRFSSSAWPEGLSLSTAEEALDLALNTWLLPECVNLVLRRAATSSHSIGPMDGVNSIAWVTNWAEKGFPSDAAGSTDVQYVSKDGDWKIEEADVYLNAENFNWPSSDRDLTAVLVHEIGHALGLMHPCEPHGELGVPICEEDEEFAESAMFPIYHDLQNELATDDIQGICYLYGTTSAQCGDCGLGLACIEGVCRAVCANEVCDPGESCSARGCVSAGACLDLDCSGQECTQDSECAPLGRCDLNVCRRGARVNGEGCDTSADCFEGVCTSGKCEPECTHQGSCGRWGTCIEAVEEGLWGCVNAGLYAFGYPCGEGADCESGICAHTATESVCTIECRGGCPDGYQCTTVDERNVCLPPVFVATGGGCALHTVPNGVSAAAAAWWVLLLTAGVWVRALRRGTNE